LNNEHIVKIGLTFFWFSAPALLVVSVIFFRSETSANWKRMRV